MPIVNIQGQNFNLRDNVCSENKEYIRKNVKYNIYVQIPNVCNANCLFCNKNKENLNFDIENMIISIKQILEKVTISGISITGGEPFKDFQLLKNIVVAINNIAKTIPISINTNGLNLHKAIELEPYIDKIHISRHHYDDNINQSIFNTSSAPTLEQIKNLSKQTRENYVQLNCLLIKGYIDSAAEVEKYLQQDVYNCGFIGLMPINQYSIDNFIDYKTIFPIKSEKHIYPACYINSQFNQQDLKAVCSCMNGMFLNNEKLNRYYARSVEWLDCKCNNFIIYDGHQLKGDFS